MKYIYIKIFLFFLLSSTISLAQELTQGVVNGTVLFENGKPATGATVQVVAGEQKVEVDQDGKFRLLLYKGHKYSLRVSYLGNESTLVNVDLENADQREIIVRLKESKQTIKDVSVTGKTANQKAEEQVIKAEIVDTKAAQSQSATLSELMNRSPGIRIRQSGGLGSSTSIMLNGFSGKAIKIFKDGVPTDYLGAAFNFSTLPVNMLERVEVYKGVLPTSLGADALGGAVNLVSREDGNPYVAVSYELGSFNTHRISANWSHSIPNKRYFFGGNAFYNYSDNSYHVTADIWDKATGNEVPTRVKLFHNDYSQIYAEVFGGLKDLTWADELRIGVTTFSIDRANQFAARMETPFGKARSKQYAPVIPSLRYKKLFMDDRLSVDQFVVYSRANSKQIDTLSGSYDWYGQYHLPKNKDDRGEASGATLASIWFSNLTTRTAAEYRISDKHGLSFNLVFNDYSRKGKDPFGPKSSGPNPVDMQSLPADYTKTVAALGWHALLGKNDFIEQLFQVKYYRSKARGQEVDESTSLFLDKISEGKTSSRGVAEALKFNFSKQTFVRVSGELARRLPEQSEILGDAAYGLANFSLKPERSINGNLGFGTGKENVFSLEINSFYRITKDLMLTAPVGFLYSRTENVEQVRGIGLETDLSVYPYRWLKLNGNFTYQDFKLYKIKDPTMTHLEGARLRNTPYFFANTSVEFRLAKLLQPTDNWHIYWHGNFVRQYYLDYIPRDTEPDGFLALWGEAKIDAPNIIPNQFLQTVGLVWSPSSKLPLTVNLECKNLADKDVYDNFKIQNAGRSFHLKLNYQLHY